MNSIYRLGQIAVILTFVIGSCSTQTAQPTAVVDTENKPIPSKIPTSFPKSTWTPDTLPTIFSAINITQPSSIQLPIWINDPSTQVLLVPTGTFQEGYKTLALFNALTSEKFDISLPLNSGDYFWMPDGSQIGFLSRDLSAITLISTKDGNISTIPTPANSIRFYQPAYPGSPPNPLQASGSKIDDPNFMFLPSWMPLSPDRKYFIYQEKYDETYTSVFDISANKIIYISDPKDEYFDLFSEWAPNSHLLAIVEVDQEPLNFYTFETLPTFRLRIYDVDTQQLVTSYKNVSFPKWSPDGTKFLFQEWKKLEYFNWFAESPPCVFDTISGATNCYNETITYHKKSPDSYLTFSSVNWSPDQTMIGYIYSASGHGGFCTITLISGKINCILEKLETDDQKIIEYMWSPDSSYIAFEYDTVGPYSDDTDHPKVGVANIKTGEYFIIGDKINLFPVGLWKPSTSP